MARRLSRLPSVGPKRRGRFAALAVAVLAVHACVTRDIAGRMQDLATAATMPARIEVAYVRSLEPEAPPAWAPTAPTPAPPRPRAAAPAEPASAPAAALAAARAAAAASAAAAREAQQKVAEQKVAEQQAAERQAAERQAMDDEAARREADAAAARATEQATAAVAQAAAAAESDAVAASAAAAIRATRPAASPAAAGVQPELAAAATAASGTSAPGAGSRGSGSGEPFDWPASTRVSFLLTGNYRGQVNGNAQVEWIRVGTRYQVNLDLLVGPEFAPIISRRMSSEGDLTADGLAPQRYDEDTQIMFRERRRVTVKFEADGVVLANGERRERWRGVQDTASQFVQLTYLFTLRPELLKVGGTVEVPLALPRSMDRWIYDIVDESVIQTSFGPLPAFHLKPRRVRPRSSELSAEIWFSPQLRYLPVRIRIEQDPQTYVDLVIARKPELASR